MEDKIEIIPFTMEQVLHDLSLSMGYTDCRYPQGLRSLTSDDKKTVLDSMEEIAQFISFEQAIIKKDNRTKPNEPAIIKYRLNSTTDKTVKEFYNSIEFLEPPKIGKGKMAVIKFKDYEKDGDQDYHKMVYIVDKIKDSFTHMPGDTLNYQIIKKNEKIYIRINNVYEDSSLKCDVPLESFKRFNIKIDNLTCLERTMIGEQLVEEGITDSVERIPNYLDTLFEQNPEGMYELQNKVKDIQRVLPLDAYSYLTILNMTCQKQDGSLSFYFPHLKNGRLYSTDYDDFINKIQDQVSSLCENYKRFVKQNLYSNYTTPMFIEGIFGLSKQSSSKHLVSEMLKSYSSKIIDGVRNSASHFNTVANGLHSISCFDFVTNSYLSCVNENTESNFEWHTDAYEYHAFLRSMNAPLIDLSVKEQELMNYIKAKQANPRKPMPDSIKELFNYLGLVLMTYRRMLNHYILIQKSQRKSGYEKRIAKVEETIQYINHIVDNPIGNAANMFDFIEKYLSNEFVMPPEEKGKVK